MELIKILNRCHRFRGFVYQHARFGPDHQSIYRRRLLSAESLAYALAVPFEEDTLKLTTLIASIYLMIPAICASAQQNEIPKNIAQSVGAALGYTQGQFLSVAEAMPEAKYSFIPSGGNFKGARSFAEQVKHVACAHFAFFNEIEGKTPPEHCEKGGPAKAGTKTELLKYLRDSFEYGDRVLATINEQNALARVDGPYAGPNTRLGIAVVAVWHIADHYGQIVEYLRMNGIVPPPTQQYPLSVR